MRKYYVVMRDLFLSGWGKAEGKTCYQIVECDTMSEAEDCANANEERDDMADVEVCQFYPERIVDGVNNHIEWREYDETARFRFN